MNIAPNLDTMLLFVLFVLPGLISLHIYKLLMPVKDIEWKTAPIEALFYSSINFALCLPILIPINRGDFIKDHIGWYISLLMIVIFAFPILWPFLLRKILRNKKLEQYLQLPYPTAWDYFFGKRTTAYVLIHLKNGKKIGGYYGDDSYATSFPREGDIYLEKVVKVKDNGEFEKIIDDTMGLLIRKNDYELIEFFEELDKVEGG